MLGSHARHWLEQSSRIIPALQSVTKGCTKHACQCICQFTCHHRTCQRTTHMCTAHVYMSTRTPELNSNHFQICTCSQRCSLARQIWPTCVPCATGIVNIVYARHQVRRPAWVARVSKNEVRPLLLEQRPGCAVIPTQLARPHLPRFGGLKYFCMTLF